jgi:serine/threonine protein kinase
LIAVKRLKSSDPAEFRKEAGILKEISKKNHPHLIKLLATFHINRAYHLMFPYADGNLRKYWEDHPKSSWSSGVVLWSLKQMWGLASGLEAIHNFDTSYNGYQLDAPLLGNTEHIFYGRHGDIKPENILWFKELEGTDEGGILIITDFGLGRFHGRDSRSNIDPRDVASTPTYEPPEYALQMPVSRAYDVWSLACLYLEFVTWLLGGATMVERFADARMALEPNGIISDKFYTVQEEPDGTAKACVRDKVLIWIESLHNHEQCSDIVHNLLDLIEQELLVVDVKQRIPSWVLVKKLDILVKRAETDNSYLLHPTPRFSLENPRKGTDPELPTNSITHPNPLELRINQIPIVPPQRRSSAEINLSLDLETIPMISTNPTFNETEQSKTSFAKQRLKYGKEITESTARPSTSCDFREFFPSQRRLYIRHDDMTEDGNMNLRVEIEVPEGRYRTRIQLFHLLMHDLKARKFSLRRYCRDSGREVCHSSRRYRKPASERPAIQRSVSNALASLRNKPESKRTFSGGSLKHIPRQDSGYASNGDEDDDEVDSLMPYESKPRSSIPMPTNTTKLEFSNYALVDVKCHGAMSHKRYEFEYWGSNYAWKRVCINDSADKSFSFHLRKDNSGPAIAHIVPELHSRSQICVEEEASCWVPPCSMWICDERVWSALTDISE